MRLRRDKARPFGDGAFGPDSSRIEACERNSDRSGLERSAGPYRGETIPAPALDLPRKPGWRAGVRPSRMRCECEAPRLQARGGLKSFLSFPEAVYRIRRRT